jgi:hypothetical protein
MVEQDLNVGVVQDVEILFEGIARIDRRPGDAGAHDAQQAGVGRGMIGAVDGGLGATPQAGRQQPVGHAMGLAAHLGVGPAPGAVMQAVPLGKEIGAAVEVVDQPHRDT